MVSLQDLDRACKTWSCMRKAGSVSNLSCNTVCYCSRPSPPTSLPADCDHNVIVFLSPSPLPLLPPGDCRLILLSKRTLHYIIRVEEQGIGLLIGWCACTKGGGYNRGLAPRLLRVRKATTPSYLTMSSIVPLVRERAAGRAVEARPLPPPSRNR